MIYNITDLIENLNSEILIKFIFQKFCICYLNEICLYNISNSKKLRVNIEKSAQFY